MPRYKMMFDSTPETAKALTAIMIDQVENFAFETVAEEAPAKPNGKGKRIKISGTSTHQTAFDLCRNAPGNKVTKARIEQALTRMGYAAHSSSAVMSRMVRTKKFGKDETHFWLIDTGLTLDGLQKAMQLEYAKSK